MWLSTVKIKIQNNNLDVLVTGTLTLHICLFVSVYSGQILAVEQFHLVISWRDKNGSWCHSNTLPNSTVLLSFRCVSAQQQCDYYNIIGLLCGVLKIVIYITGTIHQLLVLDVHIVVESEFGLRIRPSRWTTASKQHMHYTICVLLSKGLNIG